MSDWKRLTLRENATINQAMTVLNQHEAHIVLVVNSALKLMGTITDGDVRRSLLNGHGFEESISKIMNINPITAHEDSSSVAINMLMRQHAVRQLPIVDKAGRLCGINTLNEFNTFNKKENPVLLMAGGLSKRLRPLTEHCPKPMLKLGGKPILERVLLSFINQGFYKFQISVNYLAGNIESYFQNGADWGVSINYLREDTKMGTAGPIGLLDPEQKEPIIVMNGDLLTKIDFDRFLSFHKEHKPKISVGVTNYDLQIPYGIVSIENSDILGIEEKPIKRYFANAGIYIIEPELIKLIPKSIYLDMPTLMMKLINSGSKISAYPITEYWLDIGRHADYERAHKDYEKHFSE